jgi:1-acyl-sn-glycerol-3-phosphate acyltransferase
MLIMTKRIFLETGLTIYRIWRTIYSLFAWLADFLIIIFYGLMAIRIYAFITGRRSQAGYLGRHYWGKALLWLLKVELIIEGVEKISRDQNYIFASNHASTMDLMIVCASMPGPFVFAMDDQLLKIPFFGAWCRFAGDLPVSRVDPKKAQLDIQNITNDLRRGESVVIFAEGGRSRDGMLHKFKSGVGVLAGESGVPVIPVAISGSFNLMRRRSIIIYPGTITVKFGPPMKFGPDESPIGIAAAVHDKVAGMLRA